MAKLEQLITPVELLDAIRTGALKNELIKQYKTNDQELAVMLQPLYRAGKMTKDEFNEFFMGKGAKPLVPAPVKTAPTDSKPTPPEHAGPDRITAAGPAPDAGAAVTGSAPPIEEAPVPGLEDASKELERAVDQATPDTTVPMGVKPEGPKETGKQEVGPELRETKQETKPAPGATAGPQMKPKAGALVPPKKQPTNAKGSATPKVVGAAVKKQAPLKAVPAPRPASTAPKAIKREAEDQAITAPAIEAPASDLISVTVDQPLGPFTDESTAEAVTTEQVLRSILLRLDAIDARLEKIEKKL